MRVRFGDEEVRRLYEEPGFRPRRFHPDLIKSYIKKITLLYSVSSQLELRQHKALRLEQLRGDRAGQHSIRLNDQFRLVLTFERDDEGQYVVVVEIIDYH